VTKAAKRPCDLNQLAKFIVDTMTGDASAPEPETKDPAAVARGRGYLRQRVGNIGPLPLQPVVEQLKDQLLSLSAGE
jgi:hypothetical protein